MPREMVATPGARPMCANSAFSETGGITVNKRMTLSTALVLSLVLFCFCALLQAQDVKYNYAPGTDFSKYKTYKWVEIQGASHPDQLISDQIKQAIDSQLVSKGLAKTDADSADMFVAYQIAVNQEKEWTATGMGRSVRWGGMGTATSSTINIGTLVVDLYDAATKKPVWRGDATKTLNPSKDPQKNQERLQKAVAKLMKNYPPKVKK